MSKYESQQSDRWMSSARTHAEHRSRTHNTGMEINGKDWSSSLTRTNASFPSHTLRIVCFASCLLCQRDWTTIIATNCMVSGIASPTSAQIYSLINTSSLFVSTIFTHVRAEFSSLFREDDHVSLWQSHSQCMMSVNYIRTVFVFAIRGQTMVRRYSRWHIEANVCLTFVRNRCSNFGLFCHCFVIRLHFHWKELAFLCAKVCLVFVSTSAQLLPSEAQRSVSRNLARNRVDTADTHHTFNKRFHWNELRSAWRQKN